MGEDALLAARAIVAARYPKIVGELPNGEPLYGVCYRAIMNGAWDNGTLVREAAEGGGGMASRLLTAEQVVEQYGLPSPGPSAPYATVRTTPSRAHSVPAPFSRRPNSRSTASRMKAATRFSPATVLMRSTIAVGSRTVSGRTPREGLPIRGPVSATAFAVDAIVFPQPLIDGVSATAYVSATGYGGKR